MIASIMSLVLSLVVPVVVTTPGVENNKTKHIRKPAKRKVVTHRRSSTRTSRRSQATKKPPATSAEAKPKKPASPMPAPTAKGRSAEDRVIDGVHRFYKDARDLRAQFTQTYTYTVYGRSQTSNGRVFFKKPGMMRWDYQKPVAKVFVADGKELWVYEPEENQAFRRKLGSSQLPVALSFMTGTGDLRQEFNITVGTENPKHFTLSMVPKKNEGDYKKVILTVDRTSFSVQASTVIDAVGNTNLVVFKDVKTNTNLGDSGFKFTPPSGVRVIKE